MLKVIRLSNNFKQSGDIMSIKVNIVTEEEWLRNVQRMSRKELLNLCIEQQKKNAMLIKENTVLLRDLASATRKLAKLNQDKIYTEDDL